MDIAPATLPRSSLFLTMSRKLVHDYKVRGENEHQSLRDKMLPTSGKQKSRAMDLKDSRKTKCLDVGTCGVKHYLDDSEEG
jgi:hypothetical protein